MTSSLLTKNARPRSLQRKLGNRKFKPKDDDDTHLERHSSAKTRQQKACPLPPCPAFLFSNLTIWCQVRIDRL